MNEKKSEELGKKGFALLQDQLSEEYTYLSPLIYAMSGQADWNETGMSTDGSTVFYNPRYIIEELGRKSKGYKALKKCYLQMVAHCLLGHVWQPPLEDAELWDSCCDLSAELLTQDIFRQKRKIRGTKEAYIYERLKSFGAEDFYTLAAEERCRKSVLKMGRKVKRDDHGRWRSGKRKCGKEAGGQEEKVQKETDNSPMKEWKNLREMVLSMSAMNLEKTVREGLTLAGYSKKVAAAEENELNYRELLRKYSTLKERKQEDFDSLDYSWYALGMDLYGNIPLIEYPEASEQRAVDNIVIAIDVSGSCDGKVACRFLRETCNIIRDMEIGSEAVNIRILECDDQIQKEIMIRSGDDIPDFEEAEFYGFGGTSFVPVFDRIAQLREAGELEEIRCLLYLSDGVGEFPKEKPDYDVVFVLESQMLPWGCYCIPDWVHKAVLTEHDVESLPDRKE